MSRHVELEPALIYCSRHTQYGNKTLKGIRVLSRVYVKNFENDEVAGWIQVDTAVKS